MPNNANFTEDFDNQGLPTNPAIIGGFCLILGLAVGAAISQLWIHRDLTARLDAVDKEIKATHEPLDQLTGFNDVTHRANSLLARLENQSGKIYKAGQTISQSDRLCDDINALNKQIASAKWSAAEIASLEDEMNRQRAALDRANQQLVTNQVRVTELESLVSKLTSDMPRTAEARASLAAMNRLRDEVINQQCILPELAATIQSHRILERSIRDLADQKDATDRAINALADNQSKIQDLAIGTEESNMVVHNVKEMVDANASLGTQVENLANTLSDASELAYHTSRLQVDLQDVRERSTTAAATLDQLAWLCDYLISQDSKLAHAEENLKQIDELTVQVERLDETVPTMVENVDLIKGLNTTLKAVVATSTTLRAELAEMVLMQPAFEQFASRFKNVTSPEAGTEVVDAKSRAKEMIKENETAETVFVSQAK